MQKEHRHRIDADAAQFGRDARQFVERQRNLDVALRVELLRHLEAPLARNQRLVAPEMIGKRIGPVTARDLEQIAEAFGRDQCRVRTAPLDERVDDQRGAVIDVPAEAGFSSAFSKHVTMPSTKFP